ncbi:YggS family pyridoxal phosphate-dependent enzyme [Teredinibacter sp. KSP-S5-2]|uniref:YggS family pyridoxal phosphate-dependent enzyme n=1 Tax=Teredinibacter sp. KSP-S5-2 TaxID=3034506 RepID=UPI002934B102|nr:YggS family pyridoxal phosphate-dependent enzyme [Teredinibacter sp. KSP-S5-2]WNO09348.1 YggS family pyridoxal phosphate-dependent enzyme [Teredinibacter sp. KSP-S5-2]
MHNMSNKLTQVKSRIQQAAKSANRNPDDITLLAVSKKQSVEKVRELILQGQQDFGENYLQEAIEKIETLNDQQVRWHFIGPIQSNKTRSIATHFDWVHSVDRLKVAQRLNDQRPEHLPPLKICIQVNIDGEDTKSGVNPSEVATLCREIAKLDKIEMHGLMCIPAKEGTDAFTRMQALFKAVGDEISLHHWDTLSMGMSADLEEAIDAGSTIVRVGTALFGERKV